MGFCIDRCLCFDRPFGQLLAIARDRGAFTPEELCEHVDFGLRCGLCRPYVRRALATGQITFSELLVEDPQP